MNVILTDLINVLQSTSDRLGTKDLDKLLYDTESLPDKRLVWLAPKALDLLEALWLRLEPRQLILVDHFTDG